MIDNSSIKNEYFNWLTDFVHRNGFDELLEHLHFTKFRYSIERDQNRAKDGEGLRYRFAISRYSDDSTDAIVDILRGQCSVLEMMVALAIRCEEDFTDNPNVGDRTSQWFWSMVVSLGLGAMSDSRIDHVLVDDVLNRFLDRDYEANGRGGLFTVRHCNYDMRNAEIWHQLCWYLDEVN